MSLDRTDGLRSLKWTFAEREWPRVKLMPDSDGRDQCPKCHGRGTVLVHPTLSPSDAFDDLCPTCDGEGEVIIEDDRYD